ncbi:MAG TPA: DNA primase [Desulfuromonadales bacterium]|nr:DNA primase [Desulfuromonadales bacterium]
MDNDPSEAIRTACAEIGTTPPSSIIFDGGVHRYHCPLTDKPGEKNAWYKACDNGDSFGGTVGHWRLNIKRNWNSRSRQEFTQAERIEYARRMNEAREKEQAERQQRHATARKRADVHFNVSQPADPHHPYLIKKGVAVHGIRQNCGTLLIPIRNAAGVLTSLQYLEKDGSKKFLYGGEITGCYHAIGGKPVDSILIAEGYATAATIFEITGQPTACAFNAGNLKPVALAIRDKFPGITIIIAADCDPVGIRSAEAAAAAVGGSVVIPDFSEVA